MGVCLGVVALGWRGGGVWGGLYYYGAVFAFLWGAFDSFGVVLSLGC